MAQVDWLFEYLPHLSEGESICSLVRSGHIDAVVIRLFSISRKWPRNEDSQFTNPVYVVSQKTKKKHDIYNITEIIGLLETTMQDQTVCPTVVISLCIGGNDFLEFLMRKFSLLF